MLITLPMYVHCNIANLLTPTGSVLDWVNSFPRHGPGVKRPEFTEDSSWPENIILVIFATTYMQIVFKNAKTEENFRANDNWSSKIGLSGKVLI